MVEQPGGTYWPQWRAYVVSELLRCGMISEQDMHLFKITDSVDVAVQHVMHFYRVYHSARYVNDDLVLRIRRRLSDATIMRLNDEFARLIVAAGRIEQRDALAEERVEYPGMPRITLNFDKKNIGQLRRMIDLINAEPEPAA
jgi:hypothetical protein